MSSIFQPTVAGDIEALGSLGKDPYTGGDTVRWQPAISQASQLLKIEYVSGVIYGTASDDIELESYGSIGYEHNGTTFQHAVLFAQGIHNGRAIAQASQPVQLYVPAGATLFFTAPLFTALGGGSGGGRLAITGTFQ